MLSSAVRTCLVVLTVTTVLIALPAAPAQAAGWVRSYGTSMDESLDSGYTMRMESDGGYVFAGTSADQSGQNRKVIIFKTDSSGTLQWAKTYGGVEMTGPVVIGTPDHGWLISGSTLSGFVDAIFWLVKLDLSGNVQWQKSYGTFGLGYTAAIPLEAGGYMVAGAAIDIFTMSSTLTLMKLDSSGEITWQKEYTGPDAVFGVPMQLADGSFLVAGFRLDFGTGDSDGWLAKLSSTGDLQWQQRYLGSKSETLFLAFEKPGGYVLQGAIGTAQGEQYNGDFWLLEVNSSGAIVSQKTFGGPGDDYGVIQQLAGGDFLITGYTNSYGAGGGDAWVSKLDSSFNLLWSKTYGGPNDDSGGTYEDPAGGFLLLGSTKSFGGGGDDGWLAKLDASGNVVWQRAYGGSNDDELVFAVRIGEFPQSVVGRNQRLLRLGVELATRPKVAANELLAVGDTKSFGAGLTDIWAASLDAEGDAASACTFIHEGQATTSSPTVTVGTPSVTAVATTLTAQAGTHTASTYNVTSTTLTLTTNDLCAATPQLTANASANPTSGAAPLVVAFTGTASNGTAPYTYSWDFGDGSAASTQQSPTHTYTSGGTFQAVLTVHDAAGGNATDDVTITVGGSGECTVTCSATVPSSAAVGAPVAFAATATATNCITAPMYIWQFGDDGSAMTQNASHTYATAGTYDWDLTVSAGTGFCTDSGSITIGTAQGTSSIIAGVAHAAGAMGSVWRTDVAAVNRGTSSAALTLTYVPYGGGTPVERTHNLAAGATIEWQDILVSLFGVGSSASAKGTVAISSSARVDASARTFNQSTSGTFGQYLPAVHASEALTAGETGVIPQLKSNTAFRSNLGVLNVGSGSATVEVKLYGQNGSQLGQTKSRTVAEGDYWQQDVFTFVGAGTQDIAYATVEVQSGTAWAFGSVVDNVTNDPTTVPLLTSALSGEALVAGVAHAEGAMGSVWRTDLAAVNRGLFPAVLSLRYVPYGGGSPTTRTHTLAAGATVEWQDILVSLFGVSASAKGTVSISSTTPVYASARTFNQSTSGTFGQYLPAVDASGAVTASQTGVIPQLKSNTAFRSNLGLLNVGSGSATVEVRLYGQNGTQIGQTKTRTVAEGDYWQQDVFTFTGAGTQDIAYATIQVQTGTAWAFGSVVDNVTNDPTTVPLLE